MKLGDLQRQVGAAGQQASLGVGIVEVGQVGHGQRHQATFVATVELARLGRRNGFEACNRLGLAAVELILGLLPQQAWFGPLPESGDSRCSGRGCRQGFVGFLGVG